MTRSIKAPCTPSVLVWARKTAGFDHAAAAKKIGIEVETLRAWESSDQQPTLAKLRKACEVYRRPLAVFFLPEPPRDFSTLRDFRQLPQTQKGQFSSKLRFLIRQTQYRQKWLSEYARQQEAKPLGFVGSVSLDDSVDAVARKASRQLRVSMADRESWTGMAQAYRAWIAACERIGVFVFLSGGVPIEEMRGFAMPDRFAPAIMVNAKDSEGGRIFSLLHEYVHLLLGAEGVSGLHVSPRSRSADARVEVFCNAVAAELLVPARELTERLKATESFDVDTRIRKMAKVFLVSREVIARRFIGLRLLNNAEYNARRDQYRRDFVDRAKHQREAMKKREGGPPYHLIKLRDNGRTFTGFVLGAYDEGNITGSDVTELLDMKLNHVGRLEAELFPSRV
ncbi:MAG: ImmA/IrrE family metallo-endopeptidase [Planctomycetes bacterium]|nr:ImmA/IrrE family metallo-endopeptidase [Planctomycetota bacterium]